MPSKARKKELDKIGLHWVESDAPGMTRRRSGKGFTYRDSEGNLIRSDRERKRLDSLAIPPAWTEVWICADPLGYVQATGRDAKGRKQSIYHPDWQRHRDEKKYAKLSRLEQGIKRVRQAVAKHLRLQGLPKQKVVAAAVRLIDETWMRVGNERYVAQNGSYGVTTLRNRHVRVTPTRVSLDFPGKGGKKHQVELANRYLAKLLGRFKAIRGTYLLQFLDGSGKPVPIKSDDVNEYLREASGVKMTAKDFRTWHATKYAAQLVKERQPETQKEVKAIVAEVAEKLGNTPAICKKSYISAEVFSSADLDSAPDPRAGDRT
jgi:DNA topoisomerase-1